MAEGILPQFKSTQLVPSYVISFFLILRPVHSSEIWTPLLRETTSAHEYLQLEAATCLHLGGLLFPGVHSLVAKNVTTRPGYMVSNSSQGICRNVSLHHNSSRGPDKQHWIDSQEESLSFPSEQRQQMVFAVAQPGEYHSIVNGPEGSMKSRMYKGDGVSGNWRATWIRLRCSDLTLHSPRGHRAWSIGRGHPALES